MAVNYKIYDGSVIGVPDLGNSDSTAKFTLGTICKGFDTSTSAYGEGEFIYVKFTGAAAIAAGDFVGVDRYAKTAVGATTSTVLNLIGLAMAAQALNVATPAYGWVMIRGVHDGANVATGVAAGKLAVQASPAGRVIASGGAGNKIDAAINKITSVSNVSTVELIWPTATGNT
jgi:hypothetical protein